jgi:hypothetical protein
VACAFSGLPLFNSSLGFFMLLLTPGASWLLQNALGFFDSVRICVIAALL